VKAKAVPRVRPR